MRLSPLSRLHTNLRASYLDELSLFKGAGSKKCLVGFSTDAWNIGQRKYKDFLAVHKMYKRIQKVGDVDFPCSSSPYPSNPV